MIDSLISYTCDILVVGCCAAVRSNLYWFTLGVMSSSVGRVRAQIRSALSHRPFSLNVLVVFGFCFHAPELSTVKVVLNML